MLVWDLATGQSHTLTNHTESMQAVAYSPDGQHLAGAGKDATVRDWDIATGQSRTLNTGRTEPVWAAAYSPDGQHLASAGEDATVRMWDLATGSHAP